MKNRWLRRGWVRVMLVVVAVTVVGLTFRWVTLERSISRLREVVSEFTMPGRPLDEGRVTGTRNSLICFMCDEHIAGRAIPIDQTVTCDELAEAVKLWSGSSELRDGVELKDRECGFRAREFRGDRGISVGAVISTRTGERVLYVTAIDEG